MVTVYTQELNWLQNNYIFLQSIVNLEKKNKILITAKNDIDTDKN
jgi:hypothetical protein